MLLLTKFLIKNDEKSRILFKFGVGKLLRKTIMKISSTIFETASAKYGGKQSMAKD